MTDPVLKPSIIGAAIAEVVRSWEKHGEHSMVNPDLPRDERLAILVEEVGEVATAMNYDGSNKGGDIYSELIQVAAMALSWAQVERYGNSGVQQKTE